MTWNDSGMGTFDRNVVYERKGITSEIVIPLLGCILLGAGGAIALTVIQWGMLGIGLRASLVFGLGVGILIASLAMTWRFYKAVTWIAEVAIRRDLDRDGSIGEPEPRIITVRANQGAPVPDARERLREQLEGFVRGCAIDTSMRRWEPILGRDKYLMFRTILMEAGHAAWKNDTDTRAGWELTAPSQEIISSFD